MKKILLFLLFYTLNSALIFSQDLPGGDDPSISPGKHFKHVATASNSTSNLTTIDNAATNGVSTAKIFVSHNYGTGVYNDHVSGIWYNPGSNKWTIFNQDGSGVVVNSTFNILVADETQSTVFQHTARPYNISNNWTALTHPDLDGNPNARIMVTQILIDTASNTYNDREVGVFYNGSKWAIFNQNMDAMPNGASFNVLILNNDNSVLHTATSGNIVAATTRIDHPSLNNNPDAIIYVTQNWNGGGASGVFNTARVSTYYSPSANKWTIYTENQSSMVLDSKYNIYFGSPSFVHQTKADNISADLTRFDNPLINLVSDASLFVLHTWNPFGSGTVVHNKRVGIYHNGSIWGIYNQDGSVMPENIYFNVAVAPKSDNAFLHTTTASNISSNYTIIDNPLLNNNPDARILIQPRYVTGRIDKNVGLWYSSSQNKWTIFNEDVSAMATSKDFCIWLLDTAKSFIHSIDTSVVINSTSYSYIDNPMTNNNPDAKILVTALLNDGNYFDHIVGMWYDVAPQKWVLFTEDGVGFTHDTKYVVYVENSLGSPTDVNEEVDLTSVSDFELYQNYPNPFNPNTQIKYSLAEQSHVMLKVYDILGKEIAILVNDIKNPGTYNINFNASGLASGVYFYTLQTEKFSKTQKMILLK